MNSPNNPGQKDNSTLRALQLQTANLSKFVVKLASFFQGVIPPLDQELENLCEQLDDDTSKFSAAELSIAKITGLMMNNADTISQLDRRSNEILKNSIKDLQHNSGLPDSLKNDILAYSDSVLSTESSFFDSLPMFGKVIDFYQQGLAKNSSHQGPETTQNQTSEQVNEHSYQDLIDELSALLGTLIKNDAKDLELPQIQAQLLHDVDQNTLLNCCRKVINNMNTNVYLERRQNEKFVFRLQSSLSDVNEAVSDSIEKVEQRLTEKDQKNDKLQEHIESIEQVVDNSVDLRELKTQASDYLAKMAESLNDRKQHDHEEQKKLMTLLNDMQSQLTSLESETVEYKKRLIELKHSSTHDPLTKIPNRIAYNRRIDMEFKRWQRSKLPLALAVLDIDHFKNINDTYGHAAGDKTLHVIAQTIRKTLRSTDFLARWGGEEFIVLFPNTEQEDLKSILESVRSKIEHIPFRFKDTKVSISLSVGASSFQTNDNAEKVFERADKNLYEAKESGRNRCIVG